MNCKNTTRLSSQFFVFLLALLFYLVLSETFAQDIPCEIDNRPIDCSRLTKQECDAAKLEQEKRNVNRRLFCTTEQARNARANGAGGGGSADSGEGEGAGAGNSERAESDESEALESVTPETNTEESNVSRNIPTDGAKWDGDSLCYKFEQALQKAQSDEVKARIKQHAKMVGC